MTPAQFQRQLFKDIKVELTDEFDRNFERKAFFDQKWPETKHQYTRGSLMMRSGKLRREVNQPKITATGLIWRFSLPYAKIQNEGGEITVTEKMKRYFWAMYYKTHNASNIYSVKSKKQVNTQRTRKLKGEAAKWKAMALQKVGSKMKIDQRQFIGQHRQVDAAIERVADRNVQELNDFFNQQFRKL